MRDVIRIVARRLEIGETIIATGREAWALDALIEAGERGCTPIERPAPRWSHYVYLLRRRGLVVATVTEAHGGAYRGTHARCRLRTPLHVVAIEWSGGRHHAA